jgi:hypothetical protein
MSPIQIDIETINLCAFGGQNRHSVMQRAPPRHTGDGDTLRTALHSVPACSRAQLTHVWIHPRFLVPKRS